MLEWENDSSRYENKSVMACFAPVLRQIEQASPGMEDLLRILAFLDPEGIQIDMLKEGCATSFSPAIDSRSNAGLSRWQKLKRKIMYRSNEKNSEQVEKDTATDDLKHARELLLNSVALPKAVQHLQRSSLVAVERNSGTNTLWIHDLISLILRQKLMNETERRRWLQHAITITCNALKEVGDAKPLECQPEFEKFVSHTETLQRHAEAQNATSVELLDAGHMIANYLYSSGRYSEPAALHERVLSQRRQVLSAEDHLTLKGTQDLARTYGIMEYMEAAEKLRLEAIRINAKVLGPEHFDTIHSMMDLILTYQDSERWKAAEKLQLEVLRMGERRSIPEYAYYLLLIAPTLAHTYARTNRLVKAEELQLQALKLGESALGEENPLVLQITEGLAQIYRYKNEWVEAEKILRSVLRTREKVLGATHPHTLLGMCYLADTYEDLERWEEAERLYSQWSERYRREFGIDCSGAAYSLERLANIYRRTDRLGEGIRLMEDVGRTYTKIFGPDHPNKTAANSAVIEWQHLQCSRS